MCSLADDEALHAALFEGWTPSLWFCLLHDPSIKVRRAMLLLCRYRITIAHANQRSQPVQPGPSHPLCSPSTHTHYGIMI